MAEDANTEKQAGNEAWSSGNYASAAEHFTKAISLGGTDSEFLKVVYSNRSAAYLKQGKVDLALGDGNKCVELDSNWVKGYSRKGDALLAARKYTEAYNAYNYGLRVAPGNATMTEKMEQAMRGIRNSSSSSSTSSGSSSNNRSSPGARAGTAALSQTDRYVSIAVIACVVVYMIPFIGLGFRTTLCRCATGLFAGQIVLQLYRRHGRPTSLFSLTALGDYLSMKVLPDERTPSLLLALILLMMKPSFLAMAPLLLLSVIPFVSSILKYVQQQLPAMQESLQAMLARFAPQMAHSADSITRLLSPDNASTIERQLTNTAAMCEVLQGLMLIFELLLPSRSILQLYAWWQYLRLRYMLEDAISSRSGYAAAANRPIRQAFVATDGRINVLLANRLCPAILRQGYSMLREFMIKQGQAPTAEGAGGSGSGGGGIASMLSKCSIM